jgi:hypothetical protein
MDTKKTLIIFGSVAAVGAAFYFILKPNSAKAATPAKKKTGGGGVSTAPVRQTKDCVVSSFNCVSTTKETIQIPLDANCMDYQPAMPQCAPSREYVAPDYSFDAYYGGYYAGYEPSGGLPYSGERPPKGQYLVDNVSTQGYYSDYAMRPRLGGPPRGRGDYRAYQMVVRKDSPYAVAAFNRRPAYV